MKSAKRILILLLLFNMLSLTGCWNYREVDNLSMVAGMAIDKGKNGYKYHASFEFLDLSDGKTGSKLLETDGDTIFDCARNAIAANEKRLFFSDCKVVVISNEIASEGIAPILDFLMRDSEPRINLNLFISKENTAGEILQQNPESDQLIGLGIWKSIEMNTASLSEAPNVKLYQATNILAEEGTCLILPSLRIERGTEKSVQLDGTAIFKKDKLVGYLNRNESKYLLFINDQIKGGLLVTSPKNDDSNITLEIQGNQTKVKPVIINNQLIMEINIKLKAALGEDQTAQNYVSLSGIKETEKSAAKTLEYGVNNVIKKVQNQYDCDVFGFGNTVYRDNPDYWKKYKSNWEQSFRSLKYTISADVTIPNTATAKGKIGA